MSCPKTIAIIGQGYVGLPLALAFAPYYPVLGYDISASRVDALNQGRDRTLEVEEVRLQHMLALAVEQPSCRGYRATCDLGDIAHAQVYIVTVPTPIDEFNAPDLSFLQHASRDIGQVLCRGDIVIYESTVYPGCTEEECVPILEQTSNLRFNVDFFVGYSPERINPGDKINTLEQIVKVTSGSTPDAAERIDALYRTIIKAGTYKAPSIKVAEAAKAIENAQRDVNISFVNELALIFDRIGIDTHDVLNAAATKFNFLKYKPGLVGGHCISVDPYYLAHKSSQLGYHPEVILSGRRVNNRMAEFVASKVVKLMSQKDIAVKDAKVLILGLTFKENCPDIRNTKVLDIYEELKEYGAIPALYDPWVDPEEVRREYLIELLSKPQGGYDAVVLAVAHTAFLQLDIQALLAEKAVVFDCKSVLDRNIVDGRL
ncbi:nucleotide sugar dehydrogenase [Sphingobacterium faecale]|uniref:Nucleotide sugar dehydrogenase n=1 Tax=Sphingobacterium faecale TaxID=2803775 RepID=A0ABS1R911_9SPHI|nr:nucleotide sugar dehydrogenase [Sphingobacterium faecale]MBL1410482.1 nucleotide sugar dehydrogenase [Sphingobacterium faecale]